MTSRTVARVLFKPPPGTAVRGYVRGVRQAVRPIASTAARRILSSSISHHFFSSLTMMSRCAQSESVHRRIELQRRIDNSFTGIWALPGAKSDAQTELLGRIGEPPLKHGQQDVEGEIQVHEARFFLPK